MGEILQDSECYILQWWHEYFEIWQHYKCSSLKEARHVMAKAKSFYKKEGVKTKYRIIKETTKQEVVYND